MDELNPGPRPRSIRWAAYDQDSDQWRADPALTQELADLLAETTDDLMVP